MPSTLRAGLIEQRGELVAPLRAVLGIIFDTKTIKDRWVERAGFGVPVDDIVASEGGEVI